MALRPLFLSLALAVLSASGLARAAATVAIPYETFRLDNGLTVVVHTDRKAPIVAVNLWYHVGAKDEVAGKTGFAHLFEHLMFQGSEHYNDEFFKPFELAGATDQNGTTNYDRTNYFQNVPTTALDLALWLESDRMGHLLGVIDQARLDEQRGVVQNEKRQGENQPYGRVWERLARSSYPDGHPYQRSVIGSMDDLEAASLEDVKTWFQTYYGPSNAVLVLAGDIDLATAKDKVTRYFGDIPAGPPLTRDRAWVAPRIASSRDTMQDRVAQPLVMKAWNVPGAGTADADLLDLAAQVLGGSAASRLDERLVHVERIADSVSTYNNSQELGGQFVLQAMVKAEVDPAVGERALDEELARLIAEGPSAAELARAKTVFRAGFVRGIERIGGFGGKADILAQCYTYTGDPGCYRESLARIEAATPAAVQAVLKRWLAQGDHTLTVLPFGEHATVASSVDRSKGPPAVESFPAVSFPTLERATLSNGARVVLARRPEVPVVNVQLLFDAGYAADLGGKLGTAGFTLAMLDEGAGKYTALDLKARAEDLGAQVYAGSLLDAAYVGVSTLADQLPASLDLLADVLLRPRFDAGEIERVRKTWLARIAQEKTQPGAIALRLLPPLLYGADHAYGIPFSGSGTEASIAALTRDDLVAFHQRWLRPDNATVLVVGDTTLEAILPLLEDRLRGWKAPATPLPAKRLAEVALPVKPVVYLVDKPGAEQSIVIAGHLAPPTTAPNHLEIGTMNAILGGVFSSRLNMNLREDKHWSYGASSSLPGAKGQRPFLIHAPVQTDKTAESIAEIMKELAAYLGERPASAEEIAKVKANDVRSMPGEYETAGAVASAMNSIVVYGRPDDYVARLKDRIEAQTEAAVHAAAREVIHPQALTWVVVGDLSKIEAPVRALNLGEVKVMDADGKLLR